MKTKTFANIVTFLTILVTIINFSCSNDDVEQPTTSTFNIHVVGTEFEVGTEADNHHFPSIAMNNNGNFAITWEINNSPSYNIFARLYDQNANPVSTDFMVNTTASTKHYSPSIAMDGVGNFVVTWFSEIAIGEPDTYARMFDNNGNPTATEFMVNTSTEKNQMYPTVAMNDSGNFVIAWMSNHTDDTCIYAQRFDTSGNPLGSELQVTTNTVNNKELPSIAMDNDGNFVIAWQSNETEIGDYRIYAQRYDSNGNPLGNNFQVNTTTTHGQTHPAINMDNNGNFVIAWDSDDRLEYNIFAQRYDNNGNPVGSEFLVNTTTKNEQSNPAIAMNDNNFIITWNSNASGNCDIFGQCFDNNGNFAGNEFQINSSTNDEQYLSSVVANNNSSVIVTWQSNHTGSWKIYAQQYKLDS